MTALFTIFLLLAQAAPTSLDQLRAEPNLERRAKMAIEFAMAAERAAEAAYSKSDMAGLTAELKDMQMGVEIAQESFAQTGRTPQRHPGPYKSAELRTQEMLVRLGDLEKRMDADERQVVTGPRAKVQEIHDAWFEGIMGKKK
ncbi:MAG: hypothetical protein ABUS49_05230 [Acidobacteriota bacterium]